MQSGWVSFFFHIIKHCIYTRHIFMRYRAQLWTDSRRTFISYHHKIIFGN